MLNTIQDRSRGIRGRAGRLGVLAAVPLLTLLSGCQQTRQSLSIGDFASAYNREIWWMSLWAIALSIIIFIGVSYALFYTVNKFREDKHDAAPAQFHGNNRLEVALVVVPVLIVFGLSVLAVKSLAVVNAVDAQAPKIDVLARQFWWNFSYPAATAAAGGTVTNGNEMIMPAKQGVTLTITSGDVIHGFWAPNIGGQRAAMPAVNKVWTVDSDRAGAYQGNCSQLCGASHANMRYKVVVLEQDRYASTVSAMQAYRAPEPAPGSAEARGYALFMQGKASTRAQACAACHRVQGTTAAGAAGPDLSFFGTRRTLGAGMWEAMTEERWEDEQAAEQLHAWLKHAPVVKPGALMPRYDGGDYMIQGKVQKGGTLTDTEIDDIAAYLRSLRLPEAADYWRDTPVQGAPTAGGSQ
ncbi:MULTISPECIES: cytochrome c oxidase subunit II [Deinococcus]|uniref:Cytochrome c oxidase subunit 2 n=1 Tax=Deinococcus rufus TaxID=2136097 RepID=A0ABV7Z3Z9_9DEIO|nr:cytochrome c oxidase subunit II [Deinococcus sp. AB2017081]WQE95500.1 cytochrome c oxidase subunit II [Deinococcus sp. AB2017081]